MHNVMLELNLAGLVNAACDEDFDPVLTPSQTYQKLVRGETERLPFAEMAGRNCRGDAGAVPRRGSRCRCRASGWAGLILR